MTTNRQDVFDNIQSTLADITILNGFKIDVVTVSRKKRTDIEISPQEMPFIQIHKGLATYENQPGRALRITQIFDLLCFVNAADEDSADDDIDDLRDSIIAALYADITRGGNAHMTLLLEEFEGVHEEPQVGQLRMRFSVTWIRGTAIQA